MAQPKGLVDDFGILMEFQKILPDDRHRLQLLESIAELESNEAHATRSSRDVEAHAALEAHATLEGYSSGTAFSSMTRRYQCAESFGIRSWVA